MTMLPWQTQQDRDKVIGQATALVAQVRQQGASTWDVAGVRVVLRDGELECRGCQLRNCEHTVAVQLVSGLGPALKPSWAVTPSTLGLPPRFNEWRPLQAAALDQILATDRPYILLEAPTGSGKSLIAAALQKLLAKPTLYTCHTKQLQDQFAGDFPYAAVLKGRGNYLCRCPQMPAGTHCDLCPYDDQNAQCKACYHSPLDHCPYAHAKMALLAADLGVVNTALFLTEANYVGRMSADGEGDGGFGLVVADETDLLEDALMRHVKLVVSKRAMKMLNLQPPGRKTKEKHWLLWASRALKVVEDALAEGVQSWHLRDMKTLRSLRGTLKFFIYSVREHHWVNCTEADNWKAGPLVFKPVRVDPFADRHLWRHASRWLMMSATVLSPEQFCRDLGLPRGDVEFVQLPSAFPVERRPVVYDPVGSMSYKNRDGTLASMVDRIDVLLKKHEGEKVLIHTVSYWLAQAIEKSSRFRERFHTYREANGRVEALDSFRAAKPGAVLVAASMARGVDLPYDACDAIIIPKVPYPALGDKQISARLYAYQDGPAWYALQTVRAIVQGSGRGMRHADDRCVTYILDSDFDRLYGENKSMFPEWWRDALEWKPKKGG